MAILERLKLRLAEAFEEHQAAILAEVIAEAYDGLVKASDFNELKEIVRDLAEAQRDLAEAQRGSEARLTRLEETVAGLAEAQRASEARLTRLEETVAGLAEAQRASEARLTRLEETVAGLAEAQRASEARLTRLEETVAELAEAQRDLAEAQRASEARLTRLEETVAELAEAQRRTEESLQKLIEDHQETRRQLGGLAMAVGYGLENQAYRALPQLLARDFGIEVKGRLLRRYVKDREGRDVEVNIIGEALRNGERIVIVGEGKSQLSKNGVDDFVRKKLKRLEGVLGPIFPVLVTHMISSPDVEDYARERGIALYYSYDF